MDDLGDCPPQPPPLRIPGWPDLAPYDDDDNDKPNIPIPFHPDLHRLARGPRTLVEYRMKVLSGLIRAKPNWWLKIHDEEIITRWRTEMRDQDRALVERLWGGEEYWYWDSLDRPNRRELYSTDEQYRKEIFPAHGYRYTDQPKQWPREPISDLQLDYVFDELSHDSGRVDQVTGIYPISIYGVYASHALIPPALTGSLVAGVTILEAVPEEEKEWHPGSSKQVLDLVHPSLYPLRIGHSLTRGETAHGLRTYEKIDWTAYHAQRRDLDEPFNYRIDSCTSRAFQWLPTDFKLSVDTDGQLTAAPLGYINNLHPKHGDLYRTISLILARFVPLWERVLTDVTNAIPAPVVDADPRSWYKNNPPEPCEDDSQEAVDTWEREAHWPFVPEPRPFTPPAAHDRNRVTLGGRTLQVIVKLANIVLTPENPGYLGGTWHVEGMANERIVATGLYYYAMENIAESRLNFRWVIGNRDAMCDFEYELEDSKGYSIVFGFGGGAALNQNLGSVVAQEGKCVAFPNIYQHRVDAFELADKARPGHRKILCFFLVDPYTRILSTSDVLPQQESWLVGEADNLDGMQHLPQELYDLIMHDVLVGAMTRGEAAQVQQELMEERKAFVTTHNETVFEYKFNMCEH